MTTRLLLAVFVSGLAWACLPPDECTVGATRCIATGGSVEAESCFDDCSDFGCHSAWQTSMCSPSRECVVAPAAGAMCVLSATPDARCATARSFCDGNDRIVCRAGYDADRSPCGDTILPKCIDGSADAVCVPAAAAPDASCSGVSRYCSATQDLVECVAGDAVFRSSCAVCNSASTSTRPCAGYLGDSCTSDPDCATGLVCHADGLGRKTCTTTCTVTSSGDDCFGQLGTGGLPFSSYAEIRPPGTQLLCVAGYCTWN